MRVVHAVNEIGIEGEGVWREGFDKFELSLLEKGVYRRRDQIP